MTAPDWTDYDVVCIASGPSVTRADCERVQAWRDAAPRRAVVVTNSMFIWCPWADVLYAHDRVFWDFYRTRAKREFEGRLFTHGPNIYDIEDARGARFENTGAGAIELARVAGAARILLLGYDLRPVEGVTHCHGDHPEGVGENASNYLEWPHVFRRLFDHIRHAANPPDIVNATPKSLLNYWPHQPLNEALTP